MAEEEIDLMKIGILKCLNSLRHNIIEVTRFNFIDIGKGKYNCRIEGYVGFHRIKKRYAFYVIPHKTKSNCRILKEIEITKLEEG